MGEPTDNNLFMAVCDGTLYRLAQNEWGQAISKAGATRSARWWQWVFEWKLYRGKVRVAHIGGVQFRSMAGSPSTGAADYRVGEREVQVFSPKGSRQMVRGIGNA